MKLDCHIHIDGGAADPARLLREMRDAGMNGGNLISQPPVFWRNGKLVSLPAAERLAHLQGWTAGLERQVRW